jgi:hypothetical protein
VTKDELINALNELEIHDTDVLMEYVDEGASLFVAIGSIRMEDGKVILSEEE